MKMFNNLISKIKDSLNQRTKQEPVKPTIDTAATEDSPINLQELFGKIGNIPQIDLGKDITLARKEFLQQISLKGSAFEALGEYDGKLEQKSNAIYDIIQTEVAQLQSYTKDTLQGSKDGADTHLTIQKEVLENAKKAYEQQTAYTKELIEKRKWNYKDFSFSMGGLYFLFAIILIAADVPLSMQLTGEGFQLDKDDLLQCLPLAIGIALSTVYVKVYYDEFIASPIEKTVTQFNASNLSGVEKGATDDINSIKTEYRRRWWIKTALLIFTLLTIFVLGIFRFEFLKEQAKGFKNQKPSQSNSNIDYGSNKSIDESSSEYFGWETQVAFIAITLLFPLIGGVLFSLGADKCQNHYELKTSKAEADNKQKNYLKQLEEVNKAEKQLKNYDSYISWCDSNTFKKDYAKFFIAHYIRGHEKGMTEVHSKKDIFAQAEALRQRHVSKQLYGMAKSISSEDLYKMFENENDKK